MGLRQSANTVRTIPVRPHGCLGLRALVLALAATSVAGFSSLAPPAQATLARLICTAKPGGGVRGGGLWREAAQEAPRWGRAGRAGLCRSLQMSGDGKGSIKSQQMMTRLKTLKVGRGPQQRTIVELHRLVRVLPRRIQRALRGPAHVHLVRCVASIAHPAVSTRKQRFTHGSDCLIHGVRDEGSPGALGHSSLLSSCLPACLPVTPHSLGRREGVSGA